MTSSAVTAIPATSQCDHIVELQLLDGALQSSGVCNLIVSMIAAKPSTSKADLLEPLAGIINGPGNLKFLDSTVNNRKKTVVARSIKGSAQQSTDLDKAVGNYLQLTKSSSTTITASLDSAVTSIFKQAQAIADALPADPTGRRVRTPKADLIKAINAVKPNLPAVSAAWQKVLAAAPHT